MWVRNILRHFKRKNYKNEQETYSRMLMVVLEIAITELEREKNKKYKVKKHVERLSFYIFVETTIGHQCLWHKSWYAEMFYIMLIVTLVMLVMDRMRKMNNKEASGK